MPRKNTNTTKASSVAGFFLMEWHILIPSSVTDYLKIKNQHSIRMRLKFFLSLQVRLRFPLKLLFSNKNTWIRFSFFLLENAACSAGYTPSGWCNVKVENLFSLELLKRSNVTDTPDPSLAHNDSICMDSNVAKNLFNTTCLAGPIIAMIVLKPLVVIAIIAVPTVLFVIALCALWTKRWNKAPTNALLEDGQSNSTIQPSASTTPPWSPNIATSLMHEAAENEEKIDGNNLLKLLNFLNWFLN